MKCVATTNSFVSTGAVSCCNATLFRQWTSSGLLMKTVEVSSLQPLDTHKTIAFTHVERCFDLYPFQQDNALAHRDREMVEFLAGETPDFIHPDLLRADTVNSFSSMNLIKFITKVRKRCSNRRQRLRRGSLFSFVTCITTHFMTSPLRHH